MESTDSTTQTVYVSKIEEAREVVRQRWKVIRSLLTGVKTRLTLDSFVAGECKEKAIL
jgi:hypothetical protein